MEKKCVFEIFNECIPYFEMLKDKQRQDILNNLCKQGELTVNEIVSISNLSTPAISHHLKLMTQSGLVSFRKEGTKKFYRAELNEALESLKLLTKYIEEELSRGKSCE